MKKQEKLYLALLAVISVIFMLLTLSSLRVLQRDVCLANIFLFTGFLSAVVFIGIQFSRYVRHIDYEKELLLEKENLQKMCLKEMEMEQQVLEELEKNIEKYMEHIQELLERSETEEIKEYTATILDECHQKRWIGMCNHPLLDAVLHTKRETCEKNAIELETDSYIPEKIPFSDAELISLYHNLLNNAIEACQRMPEEEKKWITFQTGVKNERFVLKIENSRKENEHIKGKTWKQDKAHHGLGRKIVKDIIARKNGDCLFEKKKDSYSVILSVGLEVK